LIVLVSSLLLGLVAWYYWGSLLISMPFWIITLLASNSFSYGLLTHPEEIKYFILFLLSATPQIPTGISEDHKYCYEKLTQTSRSFSAVILGLTEEFRDAIMIFYIVLRGLDTIEDDMKPAVDSKVKYLTSFHQRLNEPGWKLKGYGDKKEEIDLLENFDRVINTYAKLKPQYQEVIKDISKRMGDGMAEFLQKKVITMEDYNLYCWYVAGLVGEGLSRIFAASNIEDPRIAENHNLYKSMGLFLQKTNIIRDYLEDINEKPPRVFYPKEVWSKWANDISDFKDRKNIGGALNCLNELVTDAMGHLWDCVDYLEMIRDPSVFKFCAIPQVMAIATLYECYNNPDVFKREVKIRKTLAVKLILQSTSFERVLEFFLEFVNKFKVAVKPNHPNAQVFNKLLDHLGTKISNKLRV